LCQKNIKQLVYISSASVIGPNVTKLITEETIPEPDNHYGATKLKAEELVQNFSNSHKVPTLILRLPTLYGPNMNLAGASLKLFKLSKKPIFLLVGNGNNPYEFSYIKNISHGIVQAIEANFSGCNLYNIAENNKSSLRKIITVMSENFENKISFISLPQSLLLRLGKLGDMFSRFSGKQFPLRSRVVRGLLGGWVTDTSKAKKDFNLDQPYTLEQGIHETSDWLESVNYFE
jgi:nucleoside-diphosphate-sugar epimerase